MQNEDAGEQSRKSASQGGTAFHFALFLFHFSLTQAALEAVGEGVPVEVATDEDELVGARRAAPRLVQLAVEQHVNALEHEPVRLVLDRQHALHAEDVRALLLEQFAHPGVQLLRVEFARERDADARHRRVVNVVGLRRGRHPQGVGLAVVVVAVVVVVVAVRVILAVVLVRVVVFVLVAAVLEEVGFVVEDAVEVEALHVEHAVEVHLRVRGAVDLGGRVHLADQRFELVEFGRGREVGLVQQDHVRERDLLLHLVRVPVL